MSPEAAGRTTLPLLALCSFLVGLDALVTVPLIPAVAGELGFSPNAGGLLLTAYAAVYALSAPVFGALSDRRGRKPALVVGALALGSGTILTACATSFQGALLFRAATGLGAGILEPAVFAAIGDHFPYERRGRAMGVVTAALVFATIIGTPVATFAAGAFSWRGTLWGVGCVGILLALGLQFAISPGERPTAKDPESPAPRPSLALPAFRLPAARRAAAATFFWFAGLQGLHANLGIFYSERYGLAVHQIGLALFAAGLASILGNVAGGAIADRAGKAAVIKAAGAAAAAGELAVASFQGPLPGAVALHAAWALAFSAGHTALNAWISELAPGVRGAVLSLSSSSMYAGMMTATALAAGLLRLSGGSFVPVGAACAVFAFAAVAVVSRAESRPSTGTTVKGG